MKKFSINNNSILYFTADEIPTQELEDQDNLLYELAYKFANEICQKLNLECPDIAFTDNIICRNPVSNEYTELGGQLYTTNDYPQLTSDLVNLSLATDKDTQNDNENYALRILGTLAHECRHIWQKKYAPDLACGSAIGFTESLTDPAEIDADAFAILCLSQICKITIARAGWLVCPVEKEKHIEEYQQRIQKMEELKADLFPDPPQKKSFLKTVFGFFGGKKNNESN